jgi:hypothetical protein
MWARLLARLCVIGALEQRADFSKRGTGPHHRDEGRLLLESIAKPLKEDVDELAIRHGIAEFAELVGHGLDTLAVDAEGGGPLDGVADLGVEVVDPGDEGMTNGPSTFAYRAFRSRRDAVEGISKPTKMIAWRGPRT